MSELETAIERSAALPSPEPTPFGELGLPPKLVDALARTGLTTAFEIQARVLPDALAGRTLLGRARTGSGKTIAFGLPVLTRLAESDFRRRPTVIRGLILVPTRELAGQVVEVIEPLGRALGLKTLAIYGGASMGRQIDALRRGVDVVVATPGRLIDLIERGAATLNAVEVTVLDEADHLADLGFMPAVTKLLDQTPSNGQRLLFSATLDRDVDSLIRRYLPDPVVHAVADETPTGQVDHRSVPVRFGDKVGVTAALAGAPGRTLVFVRTKHGADRLAKQLSRVGVPAAAIHGDLRQSQRERALDGFTRGRVPVLVATDVAARGIHVDAVERVLHFDPANDAKTHLHRSGRTGRAGADGTVVTLVLPDQSRDVERMHRDAGTPSTVLDVAPRDMTAVQVSTPAPAPARVPASQPTSANRPRRGGEGQSRGSYASGRRSGTRPQGSAAHGRRGENAA
ncbi:MAG TPA: DEAD/DEAH box helicase [Frankiaceae bacterium]|nr:DEAD/DEAH box helicase [Frankiaceae bacterium]